MKLFVNLLQDNGCVEKETVMLEVRLTTHVVERYVERVDPKASSGEARLVLGRMVSLGRVRSTPRHWMRNVKKTPGLRFIYWADLPGVCGLVLDGALITLVTRELFRSPPHLQVVSRSPVRPQLAQRRLHAVELPEDEEAA
jgi:hypothetical protein